MNLLRNPGLDLPIFPADTPVLHEKFEFEFAAARGDESFVRSVALDIPGDMPLLAALRQTDEELAILASTIDNTAVVDHQWGLVRSTGENTETGHDFGPSGGHLIPKGYLLTACVEVVPGQDLPSVDMRLAATVNGKLLEYIRDPSPRTPYQLLDMHAGQYVVAENPEKSESTQAVIVDIEPRFIPRPDFHAKKRRFWR